MLIKVCGMKDARNIADVVALKPDMLGFIFYALSSRYAGNLPAEEICAIAPEIRKTGVFVNSDPEEIQTIVARYNIKTVQLHGNETPEMCQSMKERGLQVIKAIGVGDVSDLDLCLPYESCCDMLLFDTKSPLYGGTGQAFNWKILESYRGKLPFLLSGGITAADAVRVKAFEHPRFAGIDLNSRFETTPGMKDARMLASFISEIRKETTNNDDIIKYNNHE